MIVYYLAANVDKAQKTLENSIAAQEAIETAMNGLWSVMLNSELYTTLADLAAALAGVTIAILIVQLLGEMLEDEMKRSIYEKLVWLALVVALLANDGVGFRDLTLQLRDAMNGVNKAILSMTAGEVDSLAQAYDQATTQVGLQNWFNQEIQKCEQIPEPEEKVACAKAAEEKANQLAQATNLAEADSNWGENPIGSVIDAALQGWLIAFATGFQWAVEITWVLMAMAGPIAVGGTLLPVQQKSLYAWLIGFVSVGMCKLYFNVIIGMVAMTQLSITTTNTMIFALTIGILSPILATAMAAGGGMAVFSSLATITGGATGKMGAAGAAPAVGAGKGAAQSLGRMGMRKLQSKNPRLAKNLSRGAQNVGRFFSGKG